MPKDRRAQPLGGELNGAQADPASGAGTPQALELRHLRYFVALAHRGTISLEELAALQVFHGPRRAHPGTYVAWTMVLQEIDPRFAFTDPPFQHSLATA